MASRGEKLNSIIQTLRTSSTDILGAAIVSIDGFVMASALPSEAEEDVVAAMAAAMLGMSERIATELLGADMQQVFVKAQTGYVILNAAGEEAMLVTLTTRNAKLGLVFLDTRRAADSVAEIL